MSAFFSREPNLPDVEEESEEETEPDTGAAGNQGTQEEGERDAANESSGQARLDGEDLAPSGEEDDLMGRNSRRASSRFTADSGFPGTGYEYPASSFSSIATGGADSALDPLDPFRNQATVRSMGDIGGGGRVAPSRVDLQVNVLQLRSLSSVDINQQREEEGAGSARARGKKRKGEEVEMQRVKVRNPDRD